MNDIDSIFFVLMVVGPSFRSYRVNKHRQTEWEERDRERERGGKEREKEKQK